MHLLVTGANGFVGRALIPLLKAEGIRLTCATSEVVNSSYGKQVEFNLLDQSSISDLIKKTQPTHILHLAGISHVPTSFEDPELTWQVNVMGTLSLLQAVKLHAPDAFFCFISSSEVYGKAFKKAVPLKEDTLPCPTNPYAASKAAAELAVGLYASLGLKSVILRPFNHIGAGQSEGFVAPAFAKQIADIENDISLPRQVYVGNLEASRDFLHVTDVCRAYIAVLQQSDQFTPGEILNISSGKCFKIQQILDDLCAMSKEIITIVEDPALMRPSDIPIAQGDNSKLFDRISWAPMLTLTEALSDVMDYWRNNKKDPG